MGILNIGCRTQNKMAIILMAIFLSFAVGCRHHSKECLESFRFNIISYITNIQHMVSVRQNLLQTDQQIIIKPSSNFLSLFVLKSTLFVFFPQSSQICSYSLLFMLFSPVPILTNGQLMSLFSDGLERLLFTRWYTELNNPCTQTHIH